MRHSGFLLTILPALALSLALAAPGAGAVTIYKFRDSQGIVTFTDQPTKGAQVLKYGDSFVEKFDTRVHVETRKHKDGEELVLVNDLFAPVEIDLRLQDVRNVAVASNRVHQVVPARSRTALLDLKPQRGGRMHYRHRLRFALSDPAKTAKDFNYPLPWAAGQYKVSQGPGGRFSHQDEKGRHAVDIAMPVGTRIMAARAGIVVSLDQKQRERNGSRAGNYVRVLHDDGTMSVYLHLRQNGVLVKEGQQVNAGDPIAFSGNTGSSTGAHLHFVVQKNVGLNVVSVPFRFQDHTGMARIPKAGEWLGRSEVAARD